jgi:hypothetical protein
MSEDDQAKVQKVLTSATPEAKTFLTNAIAIRHSAAKIEALAKKIAGKNQAWMDENLHRVGLSHSSVGGSLAHLRSAASRRGWQPWRSTAVWCSAR